MRSGVASPPDPGTLKAAVSFDTPYAVVQHENLTFHHPGGRQAKYLETPLNASREVGKTLIDQGQMLQSVDFETVMNPSAGIGEVAGNE